MNKLGEYHDLYVQSDILLLADFRILQSFAKYIWNLLGFTENFDLK